MAHNENKYPIIKTLPVNAMTVKEYALSKGITPQYVYVMIQRNKATFKMVLFQGINFIIP